MRAIKATNRGRQYHAGRTGEYQGAEPRQLCVVLDSDPWDAFDSRSPAPLRH